MTRILLDTDTVSYFLKGYPAVVSNFRNHVAAGNEVNISVITHFEALKGLYWKNAEKQIRQFLLFTEACRTWPLQMDAAGIGAKIHADLKRTGLKIGSNDCLIAGTALANNMILCTNNTAHFSRIAELQLINWNVA